MSFSLWSRKNRKPVVGYDLSLNALNTDFRMETAASYGSDLKKLDENRAAEESQSGKEISETLYKKQQDKIFQKLQQDLLNILIMGSLKTEYHLQESFIITARVIAGILSNYLKIMIIELSILPNIMSLIIMEGFMLHFLQNFLNL